ncbi:MAG: adenosylcobinamide amidohydrolase [Anaerolineales bacterium]
MQVTPQAVWLISQRKLMALSSAVLGGGYGEFRSLFIYHVDKNYDHPDPLQHLKQIAVEKNLPPPSIGLLTAANLEHSGVVTLKQDSLEVCAIVTAGVSNATVAGKSLPAAYNKIGTINIILLLQAKLSPAALVNAIITSTEAKTDCLHRLGIRTSEGELASGTSTDAVVVAHNGEGLALPYAGPATEVGWLIGRAVGDALTKSLSR